MPPTPRRPASTVLQALLGREDRPVLGTFLPAGFPSPSRSPSLLTELADSGADFLEIGLPGRHAPMDGPAIARATAQALGHGATLRLTSAVIREVTASCTAPVVVMAYWHRVLECGGAQHVAGELADAGAAAILIPDLPAAATTEWLKATANAGLGCPALITRDTSARNLAARASSVSDWVYAPVVHAPTGYQGRIDLPGFADFSARVHSATHLPIVAGIGVSTPNTAAQLVPYANAIAVGSPIVRALLNTASDGGERHALSLVRSFADRLRSEASHRRPGRPCRHPSLQRSARRRPSL